jgi:hypothetical protein
MGIPENEIYIRKNPEEKPQGISNRSWVLSME